MCVFALSTILVDENVRKLGLLHSRNRTFWKSEGTYQQMIKIAKNIIWNTALDDREGVLTLS